MRRRILKFVRWRKHCGVGHAPRELNYAASQAKFHARAIGCRAGVRFAMPGLNFTRRRAAHRSLPNLIYVAARS